MNNKRLIIPPLILLVTLGCASLNLPGQKTPGLPSLTPNLTLTALFDPSRFQIPTATRTIPPGSQPTPTIGILPSSTLLPVMVTNTSPAPSFTNTATSVPASPTATRTQPPSATATQPEMRSGLSITANFRSTPPVIDGSWLDWTEKAYPAEYIVYGLTNWSGTQDLQSSFKIAWDDTNLYIAVKVIDDKYVQNATGEDIYKSDSIEILLDTNVKDDFSSTVLNNDDYQLGISPGNPSTSGQREAYLWYPTAKKGPKTTVLIGSEGGDGLYRVEAAIPWSVFGIVPVDGMHLGFVLSVSDNDDTSKSVQQSMASHIQKRVLTNPTTWGDLTLKR
ncbi:MAG TPA: sugar-binding protein [Anaerolineaceae bacterium]